MLKKRYIILIVVALIGALGRIIPIIINLYFNKDGANQNQSSSPDMVVNLNFRGWYTWGGLEVARDGNTVTFNGRVKDAGYVTEDLYTAMKNKRVRLEIENASASTFSEDRMLKITVNNGDQIVHPLGINDLVKREYIPPEYNVVEFVLPDDFDGKLGFVFYEADLRGLKITATYR